MVLFVQKHPTAIMEVGIQEGEGMILKSEDLLPDEQLMTKVLNSMKLHQKAKVIIFGRLDQIEEERMRKGKNPKKKNQRDMLETEVDFIEL